MKKTVVIFLLSLSILAQEDFESSTCFKRYEGKVKELKMQCALRTNEICDIEQERIIALSVIPDPSIGEDMEIVSKKIKSRYAGVDNLQVQSYIRYGFISGELCQDDQFYNLKELSRYVIRAHRISLNETYESRDPAVSESESQEKDGFFGLFRRLFKGSSSRQE
jgi:hypothetical protein